MSTTLRIVVAAALLPLALGAAPGFARTAPTYEAKLAATAEGGKLISSDRLWACVGFECNASGPTSSAARNVCVRLAKDVGALRSFRVRDRAFTPEEVAACNARAGVADQAVAAAN